MINTKRKGADILRRTNTVLLEISATLLMETKSLESLMSLWIQSSREMRSNLNSGKTATPKWASEKWWSQGHTSRSLVWCLTNKGSEVVFLQGVIWIEEEWWVVSWASNAQIYNLQLARWEWWTVSSHVWITTKNIKPWSASTSNNTASADMETPAHSHTVTKISGKDKKWWVWWMVRWVSSQCNNKRCTRTCRCQCTWWEGRCSSQATTNTCSCKWCWPTLCQTKETWTTSRCKTWWWATKWVTKIWWVWCHLCINLIWTETEHFLLIY